MRRAILLMVLLLFAPLLCLTPVTAQDSGATSVNISELGAFEHTNETYTDSAGNEYPVLFVGETFHLQGGLTDGSGEGIGMKCLNVYVNPETNDQPFSTLFTDENGLFDWFSGDSEDPFSHTGRIQPINGDLVGFWSVRVAFEPQNATEGGCAADENGTHLASHVDAPFLLKSRIDVLNLGVDEVQPDGVHCSEVECSGLYAGGTYILNLRLMHDRFDAGVNNVSLTYNASLTNESMTSSVQEHVVLTNSTGHAKLHLHVDPDLCCDVEGQALWNISITSEPFYAMLSSSMEPNFNTTQRVTVLPYTDGDGDGVHDHHDACQATRANDSVMENGCSDDDGDGVPNEMDACPNQGMVGQDKNEDGCDDANQWRLAMRYTGGCNWCSIDVRSIQISVDGATAYTFESSETISSVPSEELISLDSRHNNWNFVLDEVHPNYDMSAFSNVELEVELFFKSNHIEELCYSTSGRQFGGGWWWEMPPTPSSLLDWNLDVQLIEGQIFHIERNVTIISTSPWICSGYHTHTITWSSDVVVDVDGDGFTLPGVVYDGFCTADDSIITYECEYRRYGVFDRFPKDPTQQWDSDGDGYGDNASGTNGDVFPNDRTQWSDADGDGYGDNLDAPAYNGDVCPNIPGTSYGFFHGCPDSDQDGYPDHCGERSCIRTGVNTWDESGRIIGDVNVIDACPETPGDSSKTRFGCPDADDDGWADPTPASNVGLSDACPDRWGSNEYRGCPTADGDAAGIGLFMTSIGGFCVGLVSILVFLKLLQVGMNEINPKRYSIASVDEDDIPEPVVSGLTSPSDLEEMIPTQVGWLDDTEKIAGIEEEFVHMEDDQNAVSTQIGWLDDID